MPQLRAPRLPRLFSMQGNTLYKDSGTASYYRSDGLRVSIKNGIVLKSPYFVDEEDHLIVHSFNSMRIEVFTLMVENDSLFALPGRAAAEGKTVSIMTEGHEALALVFAGGDRFGLSDRPGLFFSFFS